MSLDISAYSKIKKLDAVLDENGEAVNPETNEPIESSHWFSVWKNPEFPGRADDIEDDAIYAYDDCTGHRTGYGGHFFWREQLSKMAGYPIAELDMGYRKEKNHFAGALNSGGGPFYELINFSDSEGVIGTKVSQKLLSDFKEYDAKASAIGGQFYEQFQYWKAAFEMASDNGCVRFH